jgi:hypothetical protein
MAISFSLRRSWRRAGIWRRGFGAARAAALVAIMMGALLSVTGRDKAHAQGIAVQPWYNLEIPDLPCMTAAERRRLQRMADEHAILWSRWRGAEAQLAQLLASAEGKALTAAQALIQKVTDQGGYSSSDQMHDYEAAKKTVRDQAALARNITARRAGAQALLDKAEKLQQDFKALVDEIKGRSCQPSIEPMSLPFDPLAFNFEGTLFGGAVAASSFGTTYSTHIFGGRSAVGIMLPGRFRLQADIEGEKTGDYCLSCGDRSYFAGGAHLDWQATFNGDAGLFGGFQTATPTFFGPTSTNSFVGVEGRLFFDNMMIGAQGGHFDVSSGLGTLTDAWFGEGRVKFLMGQYLGMPAQNIILSGGIGHASGKLSNTTLDANSTYWNATLGFPLSGSGWTWFFDYSGYTNHVQGLGTVWDEHIVKTGVTFNFGRSTSGSISIEPMQPLPRVLRVITTF